MRKTKCIIFLSRAFHNLPVCDYIQLTKYIHWNPIYQLCACMPLNRDLVQMCIVSQHMSEDIKDGPNDVPITTTVSPNG